MATDSIVCWDDLNVIIDDLDEKERQRQERVKIEDKVLIDTIRLKTKKLVESVDFGSFERVHHFWIDSQLKADLQSSSETQVTRKLSKSRFGFRDRFQ